ncbi:MAG: hypothetical protein JRD84_10130 [Deltaproteobacteria bacterium]|nr:hypothetical protein [Deltaproteobacteria bacterium]
MTDRITARVLCLAIIIIFAVTALIPVPEASAEQAGTFTGTWIASGQRQPFDFVQDREVGTFNLAGNVSLKDEFGGIEDFWAECIGRDRGFLGGVHRPVGFSGGQLCSLRLAESERRKSLQRSQRSTVKKRRQGNRRIRRR